jgi:ammonia channel protein AmtB
MMQALTLTLTLCPVILTFTLTLTRCMMRKLHIDDPLDAFAVHGACGVWGVLATGLFTAKEYSYAPHADSDLYKEIGGYDSGLFMTGTHGSLFATHVVSIIIEVAWVVTMSAIMFGLLKAANIFRVPPVRRRRHIVVADAPPPHSRLRPPPPAPSLFYQCTHVDALPWACAGG